ncbi:hypothetical protein [Roseateles sp. PN1]|uniref:hypothetical protein n=1 Tax=Roseateles sp. PN1 TaxID=3137372 RepID=UPI003138DE1F
MNFFNAISTLGSFESKRPGNSRSANPIEHARELFIAGVQKQLNMVGVNKIQQPGSWIARVDEGFMVSLRYRRFLMKLDGQNAWLRVDSIETVKKILTNAKEAASKGELDQLFSQIDEKPEQSFD